MIKKKSFTAAFTLIELLVVITIIGILAGIALPVFNSVQIRGSQTKGLAQAKQIGLALKVFAGDNDGIYPKAGVPTGCTGTYSNDFFAALFPTYTQSETIFANKRCAYNTKVPDNKITSPYDPTVRTETLGPGENAYGYITGLSDSSNSNFPLVVDAPSAATSPTYPTGGPTVKGSVWDGNKCIQINVDNSGALLTVDSTSHFVKRTDDGAGANNLIVDTSATTPWLTGGTVTVPQ